MTFKPDFAFLDEADNEITERYFEAISGGDSSSIHTLKIKNKGDPCNNIIIRAVANEPEEGVLLDTVQSTYLSLNLKDFSQEIKLSLDTDEITPFYIKWQPSFNAQPINNVGWKLRIYVDMNQESELVC